MSRLDDELRIAFKREQPSADFAARVLERASRQPAPPESWWQRLAMLLQPPKIRWIAIGVTATLLIAFAASQYARLRQATTIDDVKVAEQTNPAASLDQKTIAPQAGSEKAMAQTQSPPLTIKHRAAPTKLRTEPARRERQQELRAEAEAAKQKLMLALYIASATLNDAQKAVHDDAPKR